MKLEDEIYSRNCYFIIGANGGEEAGERREGGVRFLVYNSGKSLNGSDNIFKWTRIIFMNEMSINILCFNPFCVMEVKKMASP